MTHGLEPPVQRAIDRLRDCHIEICGNKGLVCLRDGRRVGPFDSSSRRDVEARALGALVLEEFSLERIFHAGLPAVVERPPPVQEVLHADEARPGQCATRTGLDIAQDRDAGPAVDLPTPTVREGRPRNDKVPSDILLALLSAADDYARAKGDARRCYNPGGATRALLLAADRFRPFSELGVPDFFGEVADDPRGWLAAKALDDALNALHSAENFAKSPQRAGGIEAVREEIERARTATLRARATLPPSRCFDAPTQDRTAIQSVEGWPIDVALDSLSRLAGLQSTEQRAMLNDQVNQVRGMLVRLIGPRQVKRAALDDLTALSDECGLYEEPSARLDANAASGVHSLYGFPGDDLEAEQKYRTHESLFREATEAHHANKEVAADTYCAAILAQKQAIASRSVEGAEKAAVAYDLAATAQRALAASDCQFIRPEDHERYKSWALDFDSGSKIWRAEATKLQLAQSTAARDASTPVGQESISDQSTVTAQTRRRARVVAEWTGASSPLRDSERNALTARGWRRAPDGMWRLPGGRATANLDEREASQLRLLRLEAQVDACGMPTEAKIAAWTAINEYARTCGGDTSSATISDSRMDAVVAVERAICGDLRWEDLSELATLRAEHDEIRKLVWPMSTGKRVVEGVRYWVERCAKHVRWLQERTISKGTASFENPWPMRDDHPLCDA